MGFFSVTFPALILSAAFFFFNLASSSEILHPNFTASNFLFIDSSGTFLTSRNGNFSAAMFNPGGQQFNFYLCVVHVPSGTIIWSANRDSPVSNSGKMHLTVNGMTIVDDNGKTSWSTPSLNSSVSVLFLSETGNLILLDQSNGTLWQSFHYPTDTVVMGQHLPVGTTLTSAVSQGDLSTGDYSFAIEDSDALLQWKEKTYWKLSMQTAAYKNSNYLVEYMALNSTGLYLFGQNGSVVVLQVILSTSDFRIAKLNTNGKFSVLSVSGTSFNDEFDGPTDACEIPFICHRIGLCTDSSSSSKNPTCSCPVSFHSDPNTSNCVPREGSLPSACNSSVSNSSRVYYSELSYLSLGAGIGYFETSYSSPVSTGSDELSCKNLCSNDCSCLGIFYENSSSYCYFVRHDLGSVMANTNDPDLSGYIKVFASSDTDGGSGSGNQHQFPVIALVLIPFTGVSLIIALGLLWYRRKHMAKLKGVKEIDTFSSSSGELDAFSLPGLPRRFGYEEIQEATDNFKTQIGSGGFGTVYKGSLPDKTLVAVKKITNLGRQGKKEFFTEIAIIGNVHHLNLVRLRGFCAQGSQRLLVYEYMNRGSLDKSLFGKAPVLEWQERIDIALGTARGLAYLHRSCDQKIIHCDVKPENILLHDQFHVKISDFGLSKLLTTEQSSLFTTMRGTRGYLAPEWLTSSAISEKTDVYSYGMVLLELVSGRKNCSFQTQSPYVPDDGSTAGSSPTSSAVGLVYFPYFALEMHEQRKYLELADPRLEGRVSRNEVEKLVRIALCCIHEDPILRPNMVTVVGMLEGGVPLGHPRIESLNFLRFYGRRFAEVSNIEDAESNALLYQQAVTSVTSSSTPSANALSFISSQQVSGPR